MSNALALVWESGFFAKFILLVLLLLSITGWAITLAKLRQYRLLRRSFQRLFETPPRGEQQGEVSELFAEQQNTAVSRLFNQGMRILKQTARQPLQESSDQLVAENLKQRLENAAEEEASQLSAGLPVLGSIITASPFLGLLGTVWGVMKAFLNVGLQGDADLATVAPGIAEALITTIAGLAVAIPAVFCYNLLSARLRRVEDGLYRLAGELTIYFSQRWHHEKTKRQTDVGDKRHFSG